MLNVDEIKAQLLARRTDLMGREEKLEKDIRHTERSPSEDSQERAAEEENDEVLDALDRATRDEIMNIDQALQRIDSGTYGNCKVCGAAIQAARLKLLPASTECVRCSAE